MAAVSQRGLRPRPAQVSAGFSGFRYLGATGPIRPVRANLVAFRPPVKPASFDSSDSSSWRRAVTLAAMAASTWLLRACNLAIGIVFRAMVVVSPCRGYNFESTEILPHSASDKKALMPRATLSKIRFPEGVLTTCNRTRLQLSTETLAKRDPSLHVGSHAPGPGTGPRCLGRLPGHPGPQRGLLVPEHRV
jgi:hypothetical protein